MTFGSFYKTRQSICGNDYDYPYAPWNENDDAYEICPICNGDGGVYYNEDGDEINRDAYEGLNDKDKAEWTFERCANCDGEGLIEICEPEYDD